MKLFVYVLLFALVIVSSCTVNVPDQQPSLAEKPQEQDVVNPPPIPEGLPSPVVAEPEAVIAPKEVTPAAKIAAVSYPFIGSETAPVTVVEYADFGSEINSRFHFSQIASLKRDYVQSGRIKLVIKPYPLSSNQSKAAEAAFCMWEQGSKQFWSYVDVLHRFFSHLEKSNLVNYADRIPNVDKLVIKKCLDEGKYATAVRQSVESGNAIGITEVPALVINGEVLAGDVRYSEIKEAIERNLVEKSNASANLASITGFVFSIPKLVYLITD